MLGSTASRGTSDRCEPCPRTATGADLSREQTARAVDEPVAVWMVISEFAMYTRRRRPGSAGLPRRPRDVRIATRLLVIAGVLAVVFPLWGLSLLAVLAFDRFVIRRIGAMRRLFGQRA